MLTIPLSTSTLILKALPFKLDVAGADSYKSHALGVCGIVVRGAYRTLSLGSCFLRDRDGEGRMRGSASLPQSPNAQNFFFRRFDRLWREMVYFAHRSLTAAGVALAIGRRRITIKCGKEV